MTLSVIDIPRDFIYNIKCLLFFCALVGGVVLLHRDHGAPIKTLPSKPKTPAKPKNQK